ncbi:hypothetical protein H072_8794 [Dactylellina haptotyla CBS 200.50]|uniref:Secreted protein n=1 Tax=Dactylellina haptotyla (strain CBS 200.50) TaxID=1284197 RepID=S8A8P2_DACHA|nr:hypothetical protein H072_8794 [Dactylellina haptotyla CBS 200.50]
MQIISALLLALPAVLATGDYSSYNQGQDQGYSTEQYGAPSQGYNTESYQGGQKHCIQEWFGTAPWCSGTCPEGWHLVKTADKPEGCEQSNYSKIVQSCEFSDGKKCWKGIKALCEKCY